jgi:biotin synthase
MRHDWTLSEVRELFESPLLDLVFRAACVHREHHESSEVQVCKLISIKTGACPEDCSYCSQSSRYQTEVEPSPLMQREEVMEIAQRAKEAGVTRVCLGAAWREVRNGKQFDRVLEIVKDVASTGLEVCCTLGMLNEEQYADRLATIANVRKTNVTVCTGGIIGLGETESDRMSLLHTLATMNPHPESVPINVLAKVAGTPLESQPDVPIEQTVRMIAAARILMPASVVRLSAGRAAMSSSDQALCFLAGANSIFSSDDRRMLTSAVESPDYDADRDLLNSLGLKPRPPRQTAAGGRSGHASRCDTPSTEAAPA